MFKFGLGYIAKLPRFTAFLCYFISLFLLTFLFLSCINSSETFSSIYLVKYSYNQDSTFFKNVQHTYKSSNSAKFAKMEIQAGFLSICAGTEGGSDLTCVPRHNTTALNKFIPLKVSGGYNETSIVDPLALAAKFSTDSVNPYFIVLTLFLIIISLFSTIYTASASLPKQKIAKKIAFVTTFLSWLCWTVGAIWIEVACNTVSDIASSASATVLMAEKGTRSCAMSWCSFSFLLIALIMAFYIRFKERRVVEEKV